MEAPAIETPEERGTEHVVEPAPGVEGTTGEENADAAALCEAAVVRMGECVPSMIDAVLARELAGQGEPPDDVKAMIEEIKPKILATMNDAVAEMMGECAQMEGIASDEVAVRTCLAEADCQRFATCIEHIAR